ncbi:MAG: response regulator [Thermodesulfovibrionales bacterium]|nr:response regulator [Thermodesulfovibrionales bacterium]
MAFNLNVKKVLVVDDEELILWFLEKALRKRGYEVVIARNIRDACEELSKEKFDIIFTDIRMPGGNGTELLGRMGEITQGTRVIVCSAYINNELTSILKDKGIGILKKPFRLDELEDILKSA